MAVVCIDLDGTLTNPELGITRCIRHALAELGRDVADDVDLRWCIGPPLQDSLERLLGNKQDAERALARYRERFGEIGLFENGVYDGIPEALAALRSAGDRLFVATSKPRVYAERIIDHFGLAPHFDSVFGSELDGTRTDKSDLLGWIIAQNNLAASETIMIGDRRHDIAGARHNGVRSIGVLYGFGGRDELVAAGADRLCAQPDDLAGVVAGLR